MKKHINWIFGIIFLIVGIGVMVAFVFIKKDTDEFMKDAKETIAEIIEIKMEYDSLNEEYDYTVYVEFKVDGKIYSGMLNEYNSSMREGDEVTIYYDPYDPQTFKSSGTGIFIYIFLLVGAIFAIIGAVLIISEIKKSKKTKELKTNGKIITAEIKELVINRNTTVNGRHPYQIICSANIDGIVYSFKSDNIWFDISTIVTGLGIKQVQVYINPMKPDEYHVDVDSLKQYLGN